MAQRPASREDFEIAILCALPLEYDAIALQFDEFWDKDGDQFGRAVGDPNTYSTGRIGKHNIVLALLSHMGKVNAAATAASMRSSYRALQLVILAGICGGVPFNGPVEIFLGDVVISKTIIQYDFGKKYPDKFMHKDTLEDNLSRQNKSIRNLLAIFDTDIGRGKLQDRTAHFLRQLQSKDGEDLAKYRYPGTAEDKLFESSYRHKHRLSTACICNYCHGRMDPVCDEALTSSCGDLGCDERYLVQRKRLVQQAQHERAQDPAVYIGTIASGDTVMKSGEDRDSIAKKQSILAFEMEGAGAWEELPCIVIKGVCDYSDCHKNKKWQNFAAATAASASKAVLERFIQTDRARGRVVQDLKTCHFLVPFGRNQNFVGRLAILSELQERIRPSADKDNCQRIAIEGLGGVGKTQIALEAVHLVREANPNCSVFWVPAVDATSFENAYRNIGNQMKIRGVDEDKADVKRLVKTFLSDERSGDWLLVIDNADDVDLLFSATSLSDYLPFSRNGSILFTTRNHEVAVRLDVSQRNIIRVPEMDSGEALGLLRKGLAESLIRNTERTMKLLEFLANLPLAIRQASAFMAQKQVSTSEYLELCESEYKDMIRLLSKDFGDLHRYKEIQNPVATTWLVSFGHISQHDPLATAYLKFMCLLAEKDVPKSLLPMARKLDAIEAIGTLKAYAFIAERESQDSFDMHRLVRLATRNWLEEKGELQEYVTSAMQRLDQAFPFPEHENRDVWIKYLPHAQAALEFHEHSTDKKVEARLASNIAASYYKLGKYRPAELRYRQAIQLYEEVLGKDHLGTLSSMNNLALVFSDLGKYKEAEKMYREILELQTKRLNKEHPDILRSMNNLAITLSDLGKYKEAEKMHRQTLELREKVLGKEHPDILSSMNNLALVLKCQGEHEEAEKTHRQVLDGYKRVLGEEHSDTLSGMNNLALVMSCLGKDKEAKNMHCEALKLREKVLGKEHPDTLVSMMNVANTLKSLGRLEEAEQMHWQSLELREKVLGKEHPHTLMSMNNLALVLSNMGKHKEAERMHRQEWKLTEDLLGKEHPDTMKSITNVANTLRSLGKYDEAGQMHWQALELQQKVLGKKHPDTLMSMMNVANTLDIQGKYEEAERMHRLVLEKKEEVLGKQHPDTLDSMNNLANVLSRLGKHEEAEQMHRQTLELRDKVLGKEHPETLSSMHNLVYVLNSLGKYKAAEQIYRQAVELRKNVLGKEHPDILMSMNNHANMLSRIGKHDEAEQMHRQTLELRKKVLGEEHLDTLTSMFNLAHVLNSLGKCKEAEQVYRRTHHLLEKVLGKEHPSTLYCANALGLVLGSLGKHEEAERMHWQTLSLYMSVLGEHHQDTLNSMDSLASALNSRGKYEEAEQMHRQTLELREKVLGKEHPDTLDSRMNVAKMLSSLAKHKEVG
ncbi:Nephrocystin-3 [Metarhizium anisopliae]